MKNNTYEIIHLTSEQTEKLKKCQLEMLDAVVDICNRHNLTYVLLGGTALGAVRHKGYIPWDDDIDIGMPRGDYEKLAEIAKEELPSNMFYQTFDSEEDYPLLFAKVRLNDTVFRQEIFAHLDMHQGIYIDVFPLDGCSNNFNCAKKHYKKLKLYRRILSGKIIAKPNATVSSKWRKKIFLAKLSTFIYSQSKTYAKLKKRIAMFSVDNSEYIGNIFGAWGMREVVKKEIMFGDNMQTSRVKFEGKDYNAPYSIHEYLKSLYGDYMTPPPLEKRVSHHDIVELKLSSDALPNKYGTSQDKNSDSFKEIL